MARARGTLRKVGIAADSRASRQVPNGFLKFLVTCPKDIDMLLMHNGKYRGIDLHLFVCRILLEAYFLDSFPNVESVFKVQKRPVVHHDFAFGDRK